MKSLLNPISFSLSLIQKNKPQQISTNSQTQLSFTKNNNNLNCPISHNRNFFIPKVALDSTTNDNELGLFETNPEISTSYRSLKIPKPNQIVLDAQGKVCTGPTQTRPLTEEQAYKVLDTILRSAKRELRDGEEIVSRAQLGAFFGAMTIRANVFPEATQWSEGEKKAMDEYWPVLVRVLPHDVVFIADPEGSIMGFGSSIGPQYVGNGSAEMRLVGALREVLAGGHLGFDEVKGVLRDVLPLEDEMVGTVRESLLSAFFIGQRMNRETDRELKAHCLAFDDELGPPIADVKSLTHYGPTPIADVKSLTHYGEPYDGNTRFFRSTLFVAAVRACYGESCLLHGVEWMSPKGGVTEEQMLRYMGANTHLSPLQAKVLLEDEEIGFAYISQREARPSMYSLAALREHMKKRPPLATAEKVQQFVRARGKEAIVSGFYHEGYEDPLLMLIRRRGVHSGLVVKGEEGALSMTTKLRSGSASKGLPVNYCSGFRSLSYPSVSGGDGVSREIFKVVVNPADYDFEQTDTPRTDRSVLKNIELGLAALRGERGPAYDRIVLNAGMVDHLLRCDGAEDISSAFNRAREAIDSGKATERILNYIKISQFVK